MKFDAIVVGSGITGGWAAKELTEAGLKVLMIERGRKIEHQQDYDRELLAPWELPFRGFGDPVKYARDYAIQSRGIHFNEWTEDHFVNDRENPYQVAKGVDFTWVRGYQLGGKSLTWGRQCYRWSDYDFGANARDGYGVDWPVRYAEMAPWYDKVEEFIGVSGSQEGIASLPDGKFQPPMALNVVEAHAKQVIESRFHDRKLIIGRTANLTEAKDDRAQCQYRSICARGCSYGAYFSTQSSTLPAARATGNLTLLTDTYVESIDYDAKTRRVTGVKVIDTKTGARSSYSARVVFLNAGAFNSVHLLMRSRSEAFPNGMANGSGILGTHIMDHAEALGAVATVPGFADRTSFGNRPTGIVIPRFRNLEAKDAADFTRGYSYQGGALQSGWVRAKRTAGVGEDFKEAMRPPGEWRMVLNSFVECLPRPTNKLSLDEKNLDPFGAPQLKIDFHYGDNERKALADAQREALAMMKLLGGEVIYSSATPNVGGSAIHEMGGARMGHDPKTSVINKHNQAHEIDNLFVTDGAMMASSASQNPSLTYMAFTARAAAFAIEQLKSGVI